MKCGLQKKALEKKKLKGPRVERDKLHWAPLETHVKRDRFALGSKNWDEEYTFRTH